MRLRQLSQVRYYRDMSKALERLTKAELIERLRKLESDRDLSAQAFEREERLRAILNTAVDGIVTISEAGVIDAVNPAVCTLFGYSEEELIGKNVSILMPEPDHSRHDGYLENYHRTGNPQIIGVGREVVGRRRNGEEFPLDLAVSEIKLPDRRLFTGFIRDITERKEAETALRRYQRIVSACDDLLSFVGGDYIYREVNEAYVRFHGKRREEIVGRSIAELYGAAFFEREIQPRVDRCLKGEDLHYETLFNLPRKGRRWLDVRLSPYRSSDGSISGFAVNARDMTERKELEKQIADSRVEEQQRIGRELHDNLGQQLTGIEFMSQALCDRLEATSNKHATDAAQIAELTREAVSHTRALARGLNPVVFEADGLMVALEQLAENSSRLFKTTCRFHCDKPVLISDNSVATHLYRIAQEATQNALRHGKPSLVELTLSETRERIIMAVRDNGKGLPGKLPKKRGMGLHVMHYRATLAGGSLVVLRREIGGTEVVCTIHKTPGASGSKRSNRNDRENE